MERVHRLNASYLGYQLTKDSEKTGLLYAGNIGSIILHEIIAL